MVIMKKDSEGSSLSTNWCVAAMIHVVIPNWPDSVSAAQAVCLLITLMESLLQVDLSRLIIKAHGRERIHSENTLLSVPKYRFT